METPSFYAIIPAHIRYCKELEPNAKLLYGEITALASREGYCWASNGYFAELYGVDERSIKNWIKALKDQKFITVQIEINGLQRQRKIWISPEIQNIFTKGKNLPDVGKISSPRGEKNFTHINTKSNTEEEREEAQAPPPDPFKYKRVKMDQDKLNALLKDFGDEKTTEMMDRLDEYADINPKRFKQYACHAAVIRKWLREDSVKMKKTNPQHGVGEKSWGEIESGNRTWKSSMEKILWPFIKEGKILCQPSYWEYTSNPDGTMTRLDVKMKNFIKESLKFLDEIGILEELHKRRIELPQC